MALVDDVGQQKPIRHYYLAGIKCGLDDLGDELGPASHEQKRLAGQSQIVSVIEEQTANDGTNRGAAGVGALGNLKVTSTQPIRQQSALRRFAGAVDAVQ